MDSNRFDALIRSRSPHASRRGALRTMGGLGLTELFGVADTDAKRKKKKRKCPKPPPAPFCAGKNTCVEKAFCEASGSSCFCLLRADAGHIGEPLCGSTILDVVDDCAECAGNLVCVLRGGTCGPDFGCVALCVDPL